MVAGLPDTAVRDAIFTHPTMHEGLGALFADGPARPGAADYLVFLAIGS